MTNYIEITPNEALVELQEGREVEWHDGDYDWHISSGTIIYPTMKYRKKVVPYQPEVGERVLAKSKASRNFMTDSVEFRGMVDDKHICKSYNGTLVGWDEVKPIPQKVAREWWIRSDGILFSDKPTLPTGFTHVREVIEGEE